MTKAVKPMTQVASCCGLRPIPDETRCGAWYIRCDHCGRTCSGPSLYEAAAAWNRKEDHRGTH